MASPRWLGLLALVWALAGCGHSEDDAVVYDPAIVLAFQVEAALTPEAVRVSGYAKEAQNRAPNIDPDGFAFSSQVVTRQAGDEVVAGASLKSFRAELEARFSVDARGGVTRLAEDTPLPAATTQPAEGWRSSGTPGAQVRAETEPNTESDAVGTGLDVPVKCWVRDSAELVETEVPCTPCRSRSECRLYGESYLMGAILPQGVGVYVFWAWSDAIVVFTAPFDREETP